MTPPSTPATPPSAAGARSRAAPPPRYGRQGVILVVLAVALVVAVGAVTGERGYLDVRRQRASLGKLRAEVGALRRENALLLTEVRALRSDPYVIEKIARERLGYARPGEIVFRFPPKEPPLGAGPVTGPKAP